MLYERWQQVVCKYRDEIAVTDVAANRCWTFAQLAAAAEKSISEEPVIYPQGTSFDFIITLLSAWRSGKVVCPLEMGQQPLELEALPQGCVHLKLTSATTGRARVIGFKAEQLAADVENIIATMGLRRDWPNIAAISLAHSYGFSNLVLPLVLHGIPLILSDSPLPESVRKAAQGFEAVTLASVPALWQAWHDADAIPKNVRLAISAGAPLSLKLEEEIFAARGLKVHNFYGSSECGGIAYDSTAVPRTDASCAGEPMKNVCLVAGESDCLVVRSRAVGETYWPEPTENLVNGVFVTSDLIELRDGRVFLRGRVSDQINVAGRKVSPESIERVLLGHEEVKECLVFGAPSNDSQRTEKIVACIVMRNGCTSEQLKQFLLTRLPAWQVPRDWCFVGSLAATQRGKVSRSEWRRRYVSGEIKQSE